mmetsp:Transcript_15243/g.27796  ORF Transcript_15243/g.27796 Transcript_15243/m.27796 type:complete len:262 (+) Transcript_15243:13-798(+)
MGVKLSLASSIACSASSAIVASLIKDEAPEDIEHDEVEFIEERCENLENPGVLLGAKHSYMVVKTYGGQDLRFDYDGDGEVKFTLDYVGWFSPSELFRMSKALPGTTVRSAREAFQKNAEGNYEAMNHNCQHVVRDTYNELTGQDEAILRNDYIFSLFKSVPEDRKHMLVDEDAIRYVLLEDTYRPIRNAITQTPNLYEAMLKIRKDNEAPRLRMLFYRLYDLGLIDGPEPSDEEFTKMQQAMDEALRAASEKHLREQSAQ